MRCGRRDKARIRVPIGAIVERDKDGREAGTAGRRPAFNLPVGLNGAVHNGSLASTDTALDAAAAAVERVAEEAHATHA